MGLLDFKLDDRTFDDLVAEAKQHIARTCPQWTDFNPSDPGMTLVELMAWMTETALYRLNRVPELNYVKFLELMGLQRRPAQPARSWVMFEVQKSATGKPLETLKAGAVLSTRPEAGHDPIRFSTMHALNPTLRSIRSAFATCWIETAPNHVQEQQQILDLVKENPGGTELFAASANPMPHVLFLGHSKLISTDSHETSSDFRLIVEVLPESDSAGLDLEWEVWNGAAWNQICPVADNTNGLCNSGTIRFGQMPAIVQSAFPNLIKGRPEPSFIHDKSNKFVAFWMRAQLVGSSGARMPRIESLRWCVTRTGKNIRPQSALAFVPAPKEVLGEEVKKVPLVTTPYIPLDVAGDFAPFTPRVMDGNMLYLQSEVFGYRGAKVTIRIELREVRDVQISWEYCGKNGRWSALAGVIDPPPASAGSWNIGFTCPQDVETVEINRRSGYFIRATARGSHDSRCTAKSVFIDFLLQDDTSPFDYRISDSYSELILHDRNGPFPPFKIEPNRSPAVYICLDDAPISTAEPGPLQLCFDFWPQWPGPIGVKDAEKMESPLLVWDFADGEAWKPFPEVRDHTKRFSHTGIVEFARPAEWGKSHRNGVQGCWFRVRHDAGNFLKAPRLRCVRMNCVEVEQVEMIKRVLGSSNGLAWQFFTLGQEILDQPQVFVGATVKPPGAYPGVPLKSTVPIRTHPANLNWSDWNEVPDFYQSRSNDKHFTVELWTGTITFGDGQQGLIPPEGNDNINIVCRTTAGAAGNVGRDAISVIDNSAQFAPSGIQKVLGSLPAEGGSDHEDIESVKQRAPWELKHSNRAVTREDFIQLALKASPWVAKAECFDADGTVHVVVVPDDRLTDRPQPSRRVVEQVKEYLDKRKLINTRLEVTGPEYRSIDVELEIIIAAQYLDHTDQIRREIQDNLNRFVQPLSGMRDGRGYQMGRALHRSELYSLLQDVAGIDDIVDLKISVSGSGLKTERVAVPSHGYPCFALPLNIEVTNA